MDYLIVCVEQLDRASEELSEGSAIAGRISLILTDNVVELLMHERCSAVFEREARFNSDPARPGRYSRAARVRVLGQRFDEKYKFLLAEGDLNQQELDFIRICHELRGQAYHAGITHDQFICALATEHHALACRLLVRLQPSWRSSRSGDEFGARLLRHLRPVPGAVWNRYLGTPVEDMAASLDASRRSPDVRLQDALADALVATLDSIERNLQFLVDEAPAHASGEVEEQLVEAQRWVDLFSDVPIDIQERTEEYGQFILERRSQMEVSWEPRFRTLPMDSWRRRAEAVRGATTMSALTRYEQLSNEVEYIRDVAESTARGLAAHLDAEFEAERDRLRGL